jgi:hypothetical protein
MIDWKKTYDYYHFQYYQHVENYFFLQFWFYNVLKKECLSGFSFSIDVDIFTLLHYYKPFYNYYHIDEYPYETIYIRSITGNRDCDLQKSINPKN